MNNISKILGVNNWEPHLRIEKPSFSLPRLTCLFKAVVLGALAMTGQASAKGINLRWDGGVQLPTIDFKALAHPRAEFGPIATPSLQCYLKQKEHLMGLEQRSDELQEMFSILPAAPKGEGNVQGLEVYIKKTAFLTPVHATPRSRFPENFSAFMYTGTVLIENGSAGCRIHNLQHYRSCSSEEYPYAKKVIKDFGLTGQYYNERTYRNGGALFEGKKTTVLIGINPQAHATYYEAMKKIESEWLNNPCFFEQDDKAIEAFILEIHRIMIRGEAGASEETQEKLAIPGYRKDLVDVLLDKKYYDPSTFKSAFKKNGGTDREWALLAEVAKRRDAQVDDGLTDREFYKQKLNAKERAVWDKWFYYPPVPEEVPQKMLAFIKKLKAYVSAGAHPVAVAAWAHCSLVRIHPFQDGNGRFARFFLNGYLIYNGYEAIIFHNEDEYMRAVARDGKERGYFAEYVAKLIVSQANDAPMFLYQD